MVMSIVYFQIQMLIKFQCRFGKISLLTVILVLTSKVVVHNLQSFRTISDFDKHSLTVASDVSYLLFLVHLANFQVIRLLGLDYNLHHELVESAYGAKSLCCSTTTA